MTLKPGFPTFPPAKNGGKLRRALGALAGSVGIFLVLNSLSSYLNWVKEERLICPKSEMVQAVGKSIKKYHTSKIFQGIFALDTLCKGYKDGKVGGTLCPEFCDLKSIVVSDCQAHHFVKAAVFSAIWKTKGEVTFSTRDCL